MHQRSDQCAGAYSPKAQLFQETGTGNVCALTINQYSKFMWIFVDSLAHDMATDLLHIFPDHFNFHRLQCKFDCFSPFRIMNHGFKFSTAIYTTYFTGKVPTNYAGHEIFSDNLFYQFSRARIHIIERWLFTAPDMRMRFVGSHFPAIALLGSASEHYFEHIEEISHESRILEFLRRSDIDEYLNTASKSSTSIIFNTVLLDEGIHRTGKKDPRNQALVTDMLDVVKNMKEFIDAHPDYLFIMSSDHGGSPTGGVNEGQLHGIPDGGNEAWILFYNPKLQPLTEQRTWMDTVDVAGTIAKYFVGANIPMESIGKIVSSNDDIAHTYKVVRSNAMQIKQLADLKEFPYDEQLFRSSVEDPDIPMAIDRMGQFILSIKEPLINYKKFPLKELILDGVLVVLFQILLFLYEFRGMQNLVQTWREGIVTSLAPFLYLYLDLLFLKFDYFKLFDQIFVYYTVIWGVCFYHSLVLGNADSATASTVTPTKNTGSIPQTTEDSSEATYITISRNMTILFALWCGSRLYFNYLNLDLPFPHLLGFLIATGMLLWHLTKTERYPSSLVRGKMIHSSSL